VVRKKAPTSSAKKDEKAGNAARRAGAELETIKKCTVFESFFIVSLTSSVFFGTCLYLTQLRHSL